MSCNKQADGDHGDLLEEQLGHAYGVREALHAGEVREEDHVPGGQTDSEQSCAVQLVTLHDEHTQHQHQDLLRMVQEREDDEVLVQSLIVWREVRAPDQLLNHDEVAPVEVLLGQLRLRQPDQAIEQERGG